MQTKKRAKPVKFGKTAVKEEPKETKIELSKETAEADINSEEAKEIKQLIEEKTHPKDDVPEEETSTSNAAEADVEEDKEDMLAEQEEASEEEPKDVKLSENPPEKQEEDMPLENTEPVTEVEPDELHEKESPSQFGSFTKEPPRVKSKNNYIKFFLLIACITFVAGLILIGGISYFSSSMSNSSTMVISNPTPSPSTISGPTASPTPEKPDLSAYSIKVLNGSGTTGEAGKVKSLLEDKGFSVASVGNASTSDYTKTEISAKKSVSEAYINELIKALQTNYSVNSVVNTSSSQATDVVVIVGSDTAK